MEKKFIRVRSVGDITATILLIISGCTLMILPTDASVNITGFILFFAGIVLALFLKSGYKDMDTGERYCKKEHFFKQAMNADICKSIAQDPESIDLTEEDMGNSVRLDIYFNKAVKKAYIQLYEYIPYTYKACSRMYEYHIDKVTKLIK